MVCYYVTVRRPGRNDLRSFLFGGGVTCAEYRRVDPGIDPEE